MSLEPENTESIKETSISFLYFGGLKKLKELGYHPVKQNNLQRALILEEAIEKYGADEVYRMLYEAWLRNKTEFIRNRLKEDMDWLVINYDIDIYTIL